MFVHVCAQNTDAFLVLDNCTETNVVRCELAARSVCRKCVMFPALEKRPVAAQLFCQDVAKPSMVVFDLPFRQSGTGIVQFWSF